MLDRVCNFVGQVPSEQEKLIILIKYIYTLTYKAEARVSEKKQQCVTRFFLCERLGVGAVEWQNCMLEPVCMCSFFFLLRHLTKFGVVKLFLFVFFY